MKHAKAILFDLDGTLIDSEICHYKCWNSLLALFGEHLEYDVYMKYYSGVALKVNAQKLIEEYRLDITLDEMAEKREAMMLDTFEAEDIGQMPYADEIVTHFNQLNVPLVLVTSSSTAEVAVILKKIRIKNVFQHIITRDDVSHAKPHPEPYTRAVQLLGCKPQDCIVIEDTKTGIDSAKSAGITCIAVQPGFTKEFQATCNADALFEHLKDVQQHISENYVFESAFC